MNIITTDKLKVKKPQSMLLDEIKQLEEEKQKTKSNLTKLKLEAQIIKLRLKLSSQ